MKLFFCLIFLLITSCTGIPEGIIAVKPFELNRYLGKWHEIARLDHSFKRDLNAIIAEYSLADDGGVKVLNSGYNEKTGELEQAVGIAFFTGNSDVGSLKVSFLGPFFMGVIM